MPTRAMEQSPRMRPFHLPAAASESSFFSDELHLRTERQVGQLKQESVPELGVEKLKPIGARVVDRLETMQPYKLMDQKTQYGLERRLLGQERHVNLLPNPCRVDQDPAHQHDSFSMTSSLFPNGATENLNGTHYENGLFSSSLPDIFNNKMRLISKNAHSGQLVEKVDLDQVDDELFELTDEIEAQTIGNLLPDDDDLLSGVLDNVGYTVRANNRDDIDDDIFYTGGGMELEADENNKLLELNGGVNNGSARLNDLLIGEHPYGAHHSRTLFVRDINSNVDDSELKFLFEQYGDIRSLYTASKHLGFVMISYYDIRSAENAMKALQSKPFGRRNLDIHYYPIPKDNHSEKDFNQGTLVVFNLDQSVTNDILCHIFGSYGEIKEIRNTSQKVPHKSIEFYDIRAAEAAFHALNRRDIAGQKIKIETSCSGGSKSLTQHMSPKMAQEVLGACKLENPYSAPSTCYGSVDVGPITSTGSGNGMVRILRSKVQAPISQFRGRTFLDAPSTTTQQMSSPVGITSAGAHNNQFALDELSHSLRIVSGQNNERMNYCVQDNGAFHPHSLPEFHNGLSNGAPYNLSTIPPAGFNRNSRTAEAMVSGNHYKGSPGNLSGHSSTEALRLSRTGSPLLHGHRFPWSNSNNFHHQPSSPMPWPNSGAFIDNIPSRPSTHMHGISRTSRMHENIHPMDHHVGSAPAVNPSIWERRYGYAGDLVEAVAPGFHPGSVGNNGFGSPHLHQLELSSVYPKTGGSRIDTAMSPVQIGTPSPQQRGYMLHGRSHTVPHPCSFDSRGERMRSRRNESAANQSDNRRQYELDIEKIVRGEDCRTTLMIKNIPNKYTSKMLLAVIDENHRGTYDFIYLPIDFKNKCNVGYAFINMISTEHIIPFYKTFNGRRWEKFNSEKVASLVYARIQGKSALIAHFQNSSLMNEDKRCRPILFHSDGPNAGDQEPFPVGAHIRSRSGRPRFLSVEENQEDILSTSASSESHSIRVRATSGYTKEEDPTAA